MLRRSLGPLVALGAALAACTPAPPPTVDPGLEGVWLLTRPTGATPGFGTTGPMTIEFMAARGGFARFLGVRAESGVTVCGTYTFVWTDGLLTLASPRLPNRTFVADEVDDDTIRLTNEGEELTLTRIAGAGPVVECGRATATIVDALDTRPGSWSNLNAVGSTLYLNLPADGDPVVGYLLDEGSLGAPRAYTQFVGGGRDRWVVAARSDDLFYGQCACGSSNRIGYFDLEADTPILQVNTATDLDAAISVRYGYYLEGELVIGGAGGGASNRLLTLDEDSLALVSQRTVLDGVLLQDVTVHQGSLLGLLSLSSMPVVVTIGAVGTAIATYEVPALYGLDAFGMTSTGDGLYLAAWDLRTDTTYIFSVSLE